MWNSFGKAYYFKTIGFEDQHWKTLQIAEFERSTKVFSSVINYLQNYEKCVITKANLELTRIHSSQKLCFENVDFWNKP